MTSFLRVRSGLHVNQRIQSRKGSISHPLSDVPGPPVPAGGERAGVVLLVLGFVAAVGAGLWGWLSVGAGLR